MTTNRKTIERTTDAISSNKNPNNVSNILNRIKAQNVVRKANNILNDNNSSSSSESEKKSFKSSLTH